MIDIIRAKQAFKEYVKNYNPEDPQIELKISHIERVADVAKKTAQYLNLSKEDVQLAELIGLLHDIGRFEQIRQYHTFIDKNSINHGEFGVKILFEEGLIRKFVQDNQYDNIIKKAILNHNRIKIEDGLNERELLHSKIIRDSDKTDIMYFIVYDKTKTIYGIDDFSNQKFTNEIYKEFMLDNLVNYENMKNAADILVAHFAYIFDFNYEYGLSVIKENKYIDKLYKRYSFNDEETMDKYNKIYEEANLYIDKRLKINKGC